MVEAAADMSAPTQEADEYRRRKAQRARENCSHDANEAHSPEKAPRPPVHSPGRTPRWPGEHVIGGGPWSRLPRWRKEDSLCSPSRPSTADSDLTRPTQIGRRHVHASPEQGRQASTSARPKQPAAGSPGRFSLCPEPSWVPQAPWQQRRSMHNAWKELQTSKDSALHETSERPQSAPVLSTAQEESLMHPVGDSQPAGNHTISYLQPKVHLRLPADGRLPSRRRQAAMRDRKTEAQEPERVEYVQRPHAQDLSRRPGSVPDFGKLHSAWSARLLAAKAAMQRRLTVPRVRSPPAPYIMAGMYFRLQRYLLSHAVSYASCTETIGLIHARSVAAGLPSLQAQKWGNLHLGRHRPAALS